jgi:DNA-binding transcriptional LysR family regulator
MAALLRIRDLELIVALCEEGTFTRAAKRVGITQPAACKRLDVVENAVQACLFQRKNGGVEITGSGRSFVAHARAGVQSFHRAMHEAREAKHGEREKLRIGASAYIPPALIEHLQATQLRLYRDLSIEIVSDFTPELLNQLQRREIDLALVTTPPVIPGVTMLHVASYPIMIVFGEAHPLAAKRSVGLKELVDYPWVFINRNVNPYLHDMIVKRASADKGAPHIAHRFIQADQATAFLKDNSSIAWLTPADAKRVAHHHGLRYAPLRDSQIRLEVHLAALADNKSPLISEYVRTFAKRMEEQRPPEQLTLPISA